MSGLASNGTILWERVFGSLLSETIPDDMAYSQQLGRLYVTTDCGSPFYGSNVTRAQYTAYNTMTVIFVNGTIKETLYS